MVIARIKGLKISLADERHNPTGEEMIPFLDGSKNGRIRMADFKGMALHVLDTTNALSEQGVADLLAAINDSKVIFIPNEDKTGLKVVTEVSTKDNVIHLESPDYELNSKGDKIAKVWFDTIDITTNPLKVTRGIKETIELKSDGINTRVLTENGLYTDIDDIALVKLTFKADKDSEAVYDLNSTSITFREAGTPSVHWNVEKDGNELYMNLEIDLATTTSNGLMSKDDKVKLDEELPAEIERLDKRCNRLRRRINKTDAKLELEIKERTEQWDALKTHWKTEEEKREHGDKELKELINKEIADRTQEGKLLKTEIETGLSDLLSKHDSEVSDFNAKLEKEKNDRVSYYENLNDQFESFKDTKGKADGLASLGSDGKVPTTQLPSYVDDVLEFPHKEQKDGDNESDHFPTTGESGKIYVDISTGKTYRWSGTAYTVISETLALGENNSTAFPGDRGKKLEEQWKTLPDNIMTELTDTTVTESLVKVNWHYSRKSGESYDLSSETKGVDIPAATPTTAGVMSGHDKLQFDRVVTANFGIGDVTTDEEKVTIATDRTNIDNGYQDPSKFVIPAATRSAAGVLTAGDKTKLDGLDPNSVTDLTFEHTDNTVTLNVTKDNGNSDNTTSPVTVPNASLTSAGVITAEEYKDLTVNLPKEIDDEEARAKKAEADLEDKITQEAVDRATMDTLHDKKIKENADAIAEEKKRAEAKDTAHDNSIKGLTTDLATEKSRAQDAEADLGARITAEEKARDDKDKEHDSKLSELESKLTSTTNNPITIDTTGNGNAITKATLSGKALTFSKETIFVDTTSALTISGVKTFTLNLLFSGASILIKNNSDSTRATGMFWQSNDWASSIYGIGCYTVNNTGQRGFMGWGTSPWNEANCLAVADNKLTYKSKRIVYEDDTTKWLINVDKLDGKHNTDFFLSNLGSIDDTYVDLTDSTSTTNSAFKKNLASGAYVISKSGYSLLLLHFQNSGSTSAVEFKCSYSDKDSLYFRKNIDNNRVSGPWSEIITSLHPQTITGVKTFTQSLLFDHSSIRMKNAESSANATGIDWRSNDWNTTLYSIGCFTTNNSSHYGYMGWGASPWKSTNNLTVSDTKLTYKNNDVLYNNYASAITFTGSGSVTAPHFYKQSDARLKSNIQPLTHTIDQICSIPTISFDLNNDHRIGTTALALEELGFNELVTESETLKSEIANPNAFESFTKDDKEYVMVKKVEYDNLSVLALEGIKLLRKEIEQLKASVYGNK